MSYQKVALRLAFIVGLFFSSIPVVFTQDQQDPEPLGQRVRREQVRREVSHVIRTEG